MSLHYAKTIDNTTIVQLEREDMIKNILTENGEAPMTAEVREIVQTAALSEIIN